MALPLSGYRGNRGHSAFRQGIAPQPDRQAPVGARPMDLLRKNLPNPGVRNFPKPQPGAYASMSDQMNLGAAGLTNQQVKWMKKNLLGRQGKVTGREGRQFQNQVGRYINQAGGQQAFGQMLGQMPGWNNRQPVSGQPGRNTFNQFGQQGQRQRNQQQGQRAGQGWPQPVPPRTPDTVGGPAPVGGRERDPANKMFPQQAQLYSAQQQQAPAQQQQAVPRTQQQQQVAQQRRRAQQEGGGYRPPQTPAERATAAVYGGETDPKKQAKQEGKYWRGKGIAMSQEHEAAMLDISKQYSDALISLGYAEADAAAMVQMAKERLAAKFGQENRDLNNAAGGAGMFNSGARLRSQGDLSNQAGESFDDLAVQAAQQQRGFLDSRLSLENWRAAAERQAWLDAARRAASRGASGSYSGMGTR